MKSSKGRDLIILSPFPLLFYVEVHLRIQQPGFTRHVWSKLLPTCIPKGSFIGTSSQKTSFWIIEVTPNWWVPAIFGLPKKCHRYYQTSGVLGVEENPGLAIEGQKQSPPSPGFRLWWWPSVDAEMRSGQGCHHPPPGCSPSLQQAEAQDTAELGNTSSGLKFRSVVLKWKCLEMSREIHPGVLELLKD